MIKVKIVSITENDYQKLYTGIGRANEEFNDRSYFQHAGFTSLPKANTIGIVIEDGNTYTMVATADPLADRPALTDKTDVAIYSNAERYVMIKADGEIMIANENGFVNLKPDGTVDINGGNLTVDP